MCNARSSAVRLCLDNIVAASELRFDLELSEEQSGSLREDDQTIDSEMQSRQGSLLSSVTSAVVLPE